MACKCGMKNCNCGSYGDKGMKNNKDQRKEYGDRERKDERRDQGRDERRDERKDIRNNNNNNNKNSYKK